MKLHAEKAKALLILVLASGGLSGCAEKGGSIELAPSKRVYESQRWEGKHQIYDRGAVKTSTHRGSYACRDDNVASVMVAKSVWKGISNEAAVSITDAVYGRCEFKGQAKIALNTLHSFIDAVAVTYDGRGSVQELVNNVQQRLAREEALHGESETARKHRADALRLRMKDLKDRGWPADTVDLILAKGVSLGMTSEQVVESWGQPCRLIQTEDLNTIISEEWGYGHSGAECDGKAYLHFREGVVTRIQD